MCSSDYNLAQTLTAPSATLDDLEVPLVRDVPRHSWSYPHYSNPVVQRGSRYCPSPSISRRVRGDKHKQSLVTDIGADHQQILCEFVAICSHFFPYLSNSLAHWMKD